MTNKKSVKPKPVDEAEMQRLHQVEKAYAQLKQEHALLKKAIAFTSDVKRTSSVSSPTIAKTSRSN